MTRLTIAEISLFFIVNDVEPDPAATLSSRMDGL